VFVQVAPSETGGRARTISPADQPDSTAESMRGRSAAAHAPPPTAPRRASQIRRNSGPSEVLAASCEHASARVGAELGLAAGQETVTASVCDPLVCVRGEPQAALGFLQVLKADRGANKGRGVKDDLLAVSRCPN